MTIDHVDAEEATSRHDNEFTREDGTIVGTCAGGPVRWTSGTYVVEVAI